MIYVLYGENAFDKKIFLESVCKKENIDNKINYDYSIVNIEDVIEECAYNDLFGNKKMVVLNDASFLSSKNTLENKTFENYINNPNENTIFVIEINIDKLDDRKRIVKLLKEKATIKEFKPLEQKDMTSYISSYFNEKNYKINYDAIKEIINRINTNTQMLHNDLDKLILYKIKEKEINLDDVKNVVSFYTDENAAFKLVDAVIDKNIGKIFNIYKDLIENKQEPSALIVLIANQLRLIIQCSILINDGYSQKEIATFLKEHPYRVSLALEKSYKIRNEEIFKLLNDLAELDFKIKSGKIDKFKGLETFFLSLVSTN